MDKDGTSRKKRQRTSQAYDKDDELGRLSRELQAVSRGLREMHEAAVANTEIVAHSVRYCEQMAKFHGIRSLIAAMGADHQMARQESMASREWQKAMATAIEKTHADNVSRLLDRMKAEDRMSNKMDEI